MNTFRQLRKRFVDQQKQGAAGTNKTPPEKPPKPQSNPKSDSDPDTPADGASSRTVESPKPEDNREPRSKNTFPVSRKKIHQTVEKGSQLPPPAPSGDRKWSLPDEKVNELHEAFVLFDKNQDGMITKEELGAVLRALGQRPTVSEVQALIHSVDLDQSGTIDFEEFVKIFSAKLSIDPEKELHEVFCIFDENGDGFISPDELYSILHKLGEHITKTEAQKMINEADLNRDGKVDYREFKAILQAR